MQFLLSVHHPLNGSGDYVAELPAGIEAETVYAAVGSFNADLEAEGLWVFAGGLQPPNTESVIDASGTNLSQDGPSAQSGEALGGFWVIDVADETTAQDWGRRASAACQRPVRIRPFQGMEG